jgi:MFS family permease
MKPLHVDQGGDRSAPLLKTADSQYTFSEEAASSSPVASCQYYFTKWLFTCAWPGMGLFGESYILFSIGTLKPTWEILFPDCFDGNECPSRLLHSLTYSAILGIITGMIIVGYLANTMGRRQGSIATASLMSFGALGLFFITLVLVESPVKLYRAMSVLLFVFGVGVGGEYPLSASSASEKAMGELRRKEAMEELEQLQRQVEDERHYDDDTPSTPSPQKQVVGKQLYRGLRIQLVFTMQGMGIWFSSLTMTILLILTGQTDENSYNEQTLLTIWRITYGIGALILLFVLVSRFLYLKESQVWADDKRRRDQLTRTGTSSFSSASATARATAGGDMREPPGQRMPPCVVPITSSVSSLSNPSVALDMYDELVLHPPPSMERDDSLACSPTYLLFRNYGWRLFGASFSWLLWDVAFYGNKLFQSSFLLALTGDETTLLELSMAATLNATVALLGYFGAAAIVDHPKVGRLRLQQIGFLITGSLFVGCGFLFNNISSGWLVTMYLASSFFGQLGPNATTFLIPAEIFPTEMRTMCHGIAAASGKVGALIAAITFHHVRDVDMFLISGYATFAACVVTYWCIPETTGLDLFELDKKWRLILDGRKHDYRGAANHPNYLSFYERKKLGLQF